MTDTLKSICAQCTRLNNPLLDFIPDDLPRHKEIVRRDLAELVTAASAGLEKTVVVLSGVIFESVLYSFLQAQQSYIAQRSGAFSFNPGHGLQNYMSIFNKWFRDQLPDAQLPDVIVDYRNLVHINRELNSTADIIVQASRNMLVLLNAFLAELSKSADGSNP